MAIVYFLNVLQSGDTRLLLKRESIGVAIGGAILFSLPAAMVTVIIAPCNATTEHFSATKETLLPTQRNNARVSDQHQKMAKG